jgi:hypothetical protein
LTAQPKNGYAIDRKSRLMTTPCRILFLWLVLAFAGSIAAKGRREPQTWPPTDWLLQSLVQSVPAQLAKFDAKTGRFQAKNWQAKNQNVIFPLAAAWQLASKANPYHGDEALLAVISKAGEALTEAQDENGGWPVTAGGRSQRLSGTYSRWVRAYMLVKDHLPPASRQKWEQGLQRGFAAMHKEAADNIRGSTAQAAAALYAAGMAFNKPDWRERANQTFAAIAAAQAPDGFWRSRDRERPGPSLMHNLMMLDALGLYYSLSKNDAVLNAMERGARLHNALLWPDGSVAAAFDAALPYRTTKNLGNIGFSWTAAGRGFLLRQTATEYNGKRAVDPDYAAAMLIHGGSGTGVAAPSKDFLSDDRQMQKRRLGDWHVCLSAYTAAPSNRRWRLDRQNCFDLFHKNLGMIVGGGNGKNQPRWSNFTFGELDKPTAAADNNGQPQSLRWTPTAAKLSPPDQAPAVDLTYGDDAARVTMTPQPDGAIELAYTLTKPPTVQAAAHVPLLRRSGFVRLGNGERWHPGLEQRTFTGREAGGWLEWNGLRLEFPAEATLHWPVPPSPSTAGTPVSPGDLAQCRLVLTLPFSAKTLRQPVTVRSRPPVPATAKTFAAAKLPVVSPSATQIITQADQAAVVLCATAVGEAMTFTFTVPDAGEYELLADLILGNDHGIVTIAVNDHVLGKPFDTYALERDSSGPMPLGKLTLDTGPKQLKITVTGKNRQAKKYLVGIKAFYLVKS